MPGIPPAVRPAFDSEEERAVFLDALEESLRPLMRVVFRYGVTYQELVDCIRGLYVSEVQDRLSVEGRSVSVARLGLSVGVSRGEITKLFESREQRFLQREIANRRIEQLSRLLSIWHDDSQFSTPYGAPLELSLKPGGAFRTFDELVELANLEMLASEVLEFLTRAGCVEIHGTDYVRCVGRTLISRDSEVARLSRLGASVAALNSTLVRNIFRKTGEEPFFHRTTLSDFPISKSGQKLFLALLREEGGNFVNEVDRWVSSKEADISDPDGIKCGMTLYFFEQQEEVNPLRRRESDSSSIQ
jgi:hypothetical protein